MSIKKITPKQDEFMDGSSVGSKKKDRKVFPHLRLQHEFFPETKKWEVGKEYTVTLKLKQTGLSISKFQNDSEFDIIAYDPEAGGK